MQMKFWNRSVEQIKETLNGVNECLSVSESTRMGDTVCQLRASLRFKCRQWPNPVKWERQQGYTESSDGLLCPLSLYVPWIALTQRIVIPPLITRWRAVCLPLAPLLSPPEIKYSVVTTLCSYETVWWTTGPEWDLISSFSSYSVNLCWACTAFYSTETISSALNLCVYLMAGLSGLMSLHGFCCQNQSCLRHVTNFTVLVLGGRI